MGRPANLSLHQAFPQEVINGGSWATALCRGRRDLPWTDDGRPSMDDQLAMRAVCADCPVFARCAGFGAAGRGVDGGFFAGLWLPWSSQSADIKQIRGAVRRQLKVLAGGRPVGRPAKALDA